MKKLMLLASAMFFVITSFGQTFELTPEGMVPKEDPTKGYIVLNFEGKTQIELFKAAKNYILSAYNSGKDVMSASEPEVISVFGITPAMRVNLACGATCKYKYSLTFREGKIKVEFLCVSFENTAPRGADVRLVREGASFGVFNKKGAIVIDSIKSGLEDTANGLNAGLINAINGVGKAEEW